MLIKFLDKNEDCFLEEEISMPVYDLLPIRDKIDLKKIFVDRMVRAIENKHKKYLENKKYQIAVVFESRLSEIIRAWRWAGIANRQPNKV